MVAAATLDYGSVWNSIIQMAQETCQDYQYRLSPRVLTKAFVSNITHVNPIFLCSILTTGPDPSPKYNGCIPPYALLQRSDKARGKHFICVFRDSGTPSPMITAKQTQFRTLGKNFVEFMQRTGRIQVGERVSLVVVYHAMTVSNNMPSFFGHMALEMEMVADYLEEYGSTVLGKFSLAHRAPPL
ncbi:hypothetical protein KCU73_g9901, partial [Aureobasidium melanogenum]